VIFGSDVEGAANLWIAPVDGGQPTRITRGPGASDSPSVSSDGQRLVFTYGLSKSAVYTATAPGEPLTRIMSQEQAHALSLSPDGTRLAVILGGLTSGCSLSVFDLASKQLRRVGTIDAHAVSWTPDGEALVVTADSPDGAANWVWRVPLNGGLREPLVRGNHRWQWTEVAPDGTRLAGSRVVDGNSELVVVDLDSGVETFLDRAPERLPVRWSPDGRWLAWSSTPRPVDSRSCGIWVLRLDDGERRRLSSDGSWVVWEPDGRHLIFARYGDQAGLWRVALAGGPAERLYEPDDGMWDYLVYGLDSARSSSSLVLRLETWATSLYVLEEPPSRR
jgi:Tol biopolymer transport system component